MTTQWRLNGKAASQRDVAEALALYRQTVAKLKQIEREAKDRDADARAVGAAIRRSLKPTIECRPRRVTGRREGGVRLRQFERMLGLVTAKKASSAKDGFSSFHLSFTPRGLGSRRRAKDRPYRQGEAVRAIRYILREIAREIAAGGIVSNISQDPDDIATVFNALEELEFFAGRKNANVYTSVVLALPHELDSAARERVLQHVCDVFGDLGLPHVSVLHKPDPERDERNHHAHVMFSWRPFSLTRDGCMFAAGTLGDTAQAGFISSVRKRAADAMNTEMAAAGYDRRFLGEKRADQVVAPTSGKDGTGKKHRERRTADIAAMTAELTLINDRQVAVAAALAATEGIMARPNVDRLAILNALTVKDSEIVEAARVKLLPTETVLERLMVIPSVEAISIESGSHSPVSPRTTVEPHGTTDQNLAANSLSPRLVLTSEQSSPSMPVSHEKPPAVKPSDPAIKPVAITSPVATAKPDMRSTIDTITTKPDMVGPKVRPSSSLAKATPEPAIPKRVVPAPASTPNPIIERQPDERRRPDAELLRRAARLTFPPVPAADLGNGYTGRSLQRTGGLSRLKKMSDTVVPGVTLLASSSPPTKQFGSERPAAGPLNRKTKGVRPGKQSEARREATRRGCLMELQAMPFLPIRMVTREGGRERFVLVPEEATRNDAEAIERAIQFQDEQAFQQLSHQKWAAYLARLRALLIERKNRSSPDIVRGQMEANPQLFAAYRAGGGSQGIAPVLAEAKAIWDAREAADAQLLQAHRQRKDRSR